MKTAAFLATTAVMAQAAIPATELRQTQFTEFVKQYNKQYSTTEFFSKFQTFSDNMQHIEEHNASGASWTMAMNEFGDMTADEFKAKYMGYKQVRSDFMRSLNTAPVDPNFEPAASVDWRTKGAVTPVKDQGQCGSCWAFSTTGSIEGAYELAGNSLTSFSEQQLVDCAGSQGNQGCNGGLMDYGFEYVIKNGGLCKESDYSYTARDGTCKTSCSVVKSISGYKDVAQGSETALMQAVNSQPVSIAVEADQSSFQFYSGGVMDGTCGKQLDHGVLLVGYGTDGKDYWLVKNSWGASWGESGYIRLVRGKDQCGLADSASYPTM
jgi:cathepsin L